MSISSTEILGQGTSVEGAISARDSALNMRNITKVFPGTVALEEVNLEVRYGEIHGLIGKNGAGKSTLVNILAGLLAPTSGTISIAGKDFSHLSRSQAKREGVSIVTQEPEMILDISVAENLFLGSIHDRFGLVCWERIRSTARELVERFSLDINVDLMAGDLSLSERQLLLIIKACVLEDSHVVILDEASACLSTNDNRILKSIISLLRSEGKAIVYISHHIDELLEVCDRLTVLRDGRTVATRTRSNVNPQILSQLIVGDGFSLVQARGDQDAVELGEELICTRNLSRSGCFKNVSLSLRRGEVLGIAGLRGSGRTELLRSLAGIDPVDQGSLMVKGKEVSFSKPSEALEAGIAYLPEDREFDGIIRGFSIRDNLMLNSLEKFCRRHFIDWPRCSCKAEEVFNQVQVKAFSMDQNVEELSGGNKQKVVIGRIMANSPDVYLLDEPTRGVDVGAKKSILSVIADKIRAQAGVIITSPGLDDLIDVCDRILVLYRGRIVEEYTRSHFDENSIFMKAQGQ